MATLNATGVLYHDGTLVENSVTATRAVFAFGAASGQNYYRLYNLVNNYGVVSTDTTGVASLKSYLAGASYGGDKAIFGYGLVHVFNGVTFSWNTSSSSTTNLVTNLGVMGTDVTGVGTVRSSLAAAGYGGDKAIFGFGSTSLAVVNTRNLVSNIGVVATDATGAGTTRTNLCATGYGGDKAIFGYGVPTSSSTAITNLVSNAGVVATDTAGVGTARLNLAAAGYGGDKAIFGYGYTSTMGGTSTGVSITNKVSNTGVVATDTTGVGTARSGLAAAGYGGDKAIFGYGITTAPLQTNITNKVSNAGVVATDTTGIGTMRYTLAGASYSS